MKKLIVVMILIFFIASLSFGCKKSVEVESSGKLSDARTEAYQDEELPDSVPWQDAEYYIGKTITVYGPVVETNHYGAEGEGTTFLYIGKVYPEPKSFTIWIDDLDGEKFSQDPKTYYYGKSISVKGLILESNGRPYIEVTDPNQINGGEKIAEIALEEEILSIPWNEAKYYIGETITVYGPVVATYYDKDLDNGTTFLNIGKNYPDPDSFSVWIASINREKFLEAPEIYYYDKNISATGLIVEVDGLPHMEVTDSSQVIVIEETNEVAEKTIEEETAEETVKEVLEETVPPTTEQIPKSPSKSTYLNNIANIINEYNKTINHWNTFKEDYNDLDSLIAFLKTVLNRIGEINDMLNAVVPAAGYEGAQAHFIDIANTMHSYIQQEVSCLQDQNFDAFQMAVTNFNNAWSEFISYYNSL